MERKLITTRHSSFLMWVWEYVELRGNDYNIVRDTIERGSYASPGDDEVLNRILSDNKQRYDKRVNR